MSFFFVLAGFVIVYIKESKFRIKPTIDTVRFSFFDWGIVLNLFKLIRYSIENLFL